jgi:hypothetical protein
VLPARLAQSRDPVEVTGNATGRAEPAPEPTEESSR